MNVDLPSEVYDKFKEQCANNHVLIKDEIFKWICASLDGKMGSQVNISEDLEGEKVETKTAKQDLEPILGMIQGLSSVTKEFQQWREGFRVWQDEKFEALDGKIEALDGKFKIVGKLIDSVMDAIERLHSHAHRSEDDKKGIAILLGKEG